TAKTAEEHGLRVDVMASKPDVDVLVDALADFGAARRVAMLEAGLPVTKPSDRKAAGRRKVAAKESEQVAQTPPTPRRPSGRAGCGRAAAAGPGERMGAWLTSTAPPARPSPAPRCVRAVCGPRRRCAGWSPRQPSRPASWCCRSSCAR